MSSSVDIEKRRAYFRQRYQEQREWAISYLGGKCVNCGATENLEFDHSDCTVFPYTYVSSVIRGWSRKRLMKLFKRQKITLRCSDCHREKSRKEGPAGA